MLSPGGFLLIDKPKGVSSFYCVKVLRKICGLRRIGFVGTLDPLATGLMIFALGEATKLIPYLEKMDKVYDVMIQLGATSNTYDANGEICAVKSFSKPSSGQIEELMEDEFLGPREQLPPVFSAIKIGGKRAYDLARKGQQVNLAKRPVHFFEIRMRSYSWPALRLLVHCSSGTYIRSLAHDLGQRLGCGGYVKELRRTRIGQYKLNGAVVMEELDGKNVLRHFLWPQEMFADFLQFELAQTDYRILSRGGFIDNLHPFTKGPILAIYCGKCVGVLEVLGEKLKFCKKFNLSSEVEKV